MNGSTAVERFFEYKKANCKKNTIRNYHFFLPKFEAGFGDRELDSMTTDEMWGFLTRQTDGTSQGTNREEHPRSPPPQSLRYSNLSTTQRYLGRTSDIEAMRWIDNLHG